MEKEQKSKTLKERFEEELIGTKRSGVDSLVEFLATTSFYEDPASSKYHNNFKGGLVLHSLYVLSYARALNKINALKFSQPEISDSSIVISSLLHDLCKISNYAWEKQWFKPEGSNKWESYFSYKNKEAELPLGHGELSMFMAGRHISLEDDEALAIRWHLGFFDAGAHSAWPSGRDINLAMRDYPLVRLIQVADAATGMVENTVDYLGEAQKMCAAK